MFAFIFQPRLLYEEGLSLLSCFSSLPIPSLVLQTAETVEAIVSQLLEKQRETRAAAAVASKGGTLTPNSGGAVAVVGGSVLGSSGVTALGGLGVVECNCGAGIAGDHLKTCPHHPLRRLSLNKLPLHQQAQQHHLQHHHHQQQHHHISTASLHHHHLQHHHHHTLTADRSNNNSNSSRHASITLQSSEQQQHHQGDNQVSERPSVSCSYISGNKFLFTIRKIRFGHHFKE